MANLMDYLKWRGDITFDASPFNEIDATIMSRISYLNLDDIVGNGISISDAYQKYEALNHKCFWPNDDIMFKLISSVNRFKDLKITNYVSKLDPEVEKQYGSLLIHLPDNTIVVSYRGTDSTVVGWKEDLNMSFKDSVPGQIEAAKYLKDIVDEYDNKLIIVGHSKGGNLGVYASSKLPISKQEKIIQIFNFDGPGFHDNIINSDGYKNILPKITSYVPQTSIIGMFMEHREKRIIVDSTEKGIMQHDVYSWQLLGTKFEHLPSRDDTSKFVDKDITEWLKDIDNKQREEFIDTVFDLIESTNAKTVGEIGDNKLKSTWTMLSTFSNLKPESKNIIYKTLSALVSTTTSNVVDTVKDAAKMPIIGKKVKDE